MTKYRIVYRAGERYCYFAQKKVWNLFWKDLSMHSCSGGEGYPRGAETPSYSQELVEKYIEHIAMKQNVKDVVVKTYD
jgi:hypothetical protein